MTRADTSKFMQDVVGFAKVVEARLGESKSVELRISVHEGDGADDWCEWWGSPTVAFFPEAGAEAMFVDLGGERVVIAVKSRQYQVDLESGECIVRASGPATPAYVKLKPDGTAELHVTAFDVGTSPVSYVPLDTLVQAQFAALKAAIVSAPITPTDGGAAFKAGLIAALSAWPAATASAVTRTL